MADNLSFGARVSQLGYDAQAAADINLLYDSSWPLLKIHMEGTITVDTSSGTEQTIIAHNLGYPPAFIYMGNVDSQAEVFGYFGHQSVLVDSTNLYYNPAFEPPTGTQTISYRIFRYNLQTPFTAPVISTANNTQTVLNNEFGIYATVPGKNVSSTDLRDYTINSDTRSFMVHQSVYGRVTSDPSFTNSVIATHNLSYPPMFLVYTDESYPGTGKFHRMPTGTGGTSGVATTSTAVRYFASTDFGQSASIIVFKDPFEVTNVTSVTS